MGNSFLLHGPLVGYPTMVCVKNTFILHHTVYPPSEVAMFAVYVVSFLCSLNYIYRQCYRHIFYTLEVKGESESIFCGCVIAANV